MTGDAREPSRQVRCPACGKPALYAVENPSRPFCSPRCRSMDLGAWASESYRVAADPLADAESGSAATGDLPH
jgi:endogenous inhibitor of DNA gyrase (YacG/DUF329 family)